MSAADGATEHEGLSDVSDADEPAAGVVRNGKARYGLRKAYRERKQAEEEEKKKQQVEMMKKREADRQKRHAEGEFSSDDDDKSGLSDSTDGAAGQGPENSHSIVVTGPRECDDTAAAAAVQAAQVPRIPRSSLKGTGKKKVGHVSFSEDS